MYFSLNSVTRKIINELPKNKANTFKDIPIKIIVNLLHVYYFPFKNLFGDCVKSRKFPDMLKYADIIPVFEKGDTTEKTNCRPN